MKLVVGLGNPGEKYLNTRHNAGYVAVDQLKEELAPAMVWKKEHSHNALIVKTSTHSTPLLLAKPLTFMNESGIAVASLARMHKIATHDIIIIHDDLDLPLGQVKVKRDGGTGGHNGLKSIIEKLGKDNFLRVRIGIDRPDLIANSDQKHEKVVQFVLEDFSPSELKEFTRILPAVVQKTALLAENGYELFVSKYNTDIAT